MGKRRHAITNMPAKNKGNRKSKTKNKNATQNKKMIQSKAVIKDKEKIKETVVAKNIKQNKEIKISNEASEEIKQEKTAIQSGEQEKTAIQSDEQEKTAIQSGEQEKTTIQPGEIMQEENVIQENKKKYGLNVILIIFIFAGFLFYTIKKDGMDHIIELMDNCNWKWIGSAALFLLGMWITDAIIMHIPLKKIYKNQTFLNSFKITMIGQLFNNLTPFASGGQIMQVYVMSKEGKRASDTFSVLTLKFIITQTVLIVFTIGIVLSQFNFFKEIFQSWVWIGIIGIIINVGIVVLFFLAGTKKEFVLKIAKPFVKLGSKIRIGKHKLVKDFDEQMEKVTESVENYSKQFTLMSGETMTVALMVFISLFHHICYYAITYAIYKAFGNQGNSFFEIVTTQAFLMLFMTIIPTPGAGIGAEGGFLILFKKIFKAETINVSIMFWRVFVFYLPIIIGAMFFLPAYIKIQHNANNNKGKKEVKSSKK